MDAPPPITAIALFFDDVRMEITGKNIFVGQYTEQMYLSPDAPPFDRMWVVFFVRWPLSYSPHAMAVKVGIPGQAPIHQSFNPPRITTKAEAPFDYATMQAIVQLRFLPLRANDILRAWIEVDGHEFPAGYLRVGELPQHMMAQIGTPNQPVAPAAA